MTRRVRVTVTHQTAHPWWVLPMPSVHGLFGMFVLLLWLEIAACWYTVVLGAFVVKYAIEGVTALVEIINTWSLERKKADALKRAAEALPKPEPKPEPEPDVTEPVWTHGQIVETLAPDVAKDFG